MPDLAKQYQDDVVPQLKESLQLRNIMQVPKLEKIVLNVGVGKAANDKNILPAISEELTLISGQKAVITKARKSIAGFSIREGWPIGCKVTLRGERMYQFFDRFIHVVAPRIRDFRGFSGKSFDGRGNLNISVKEQIIFPEIDYDKVHIVYGINISVQTSAQDDDAARALITSMGFPFKE